MRSKWLFILLALLVFGALVWLGSYFYKESPVTFWIVEGVALLAAVLFTLLYLRLLKPYRILTDSMDLLRAQDFSSRLRPVHNAEADRLVELFNRMIDQLKNERLLVRERNRFLDLLTEASPQGVVVMDFDGFVTDANPAALKMLDCSAFDALKDSRLKDIPGELARSLSELHPGEERIFRNADNHVYRCVRSSFVDSGFDRPFLLIEEMTEEIRRVEKASYEQIIRMMSHEVNNSVGAIGSTLNIVSEVMGQGETAVLDDLRSAVAASFDRCGNLARFVARLADVVRIPEPLPSEVSLGELVRSVEALVRVECQRRNISLSLTLPVEAPKVFVDGIQFEQVLVNIVKNAYEAIGSDGEISITVTNYPLAVTVEDSGHGIPEEVRQKLFTPFFTTKATGHGIGLTFVREVLNNHGLNFSLTNDGKTTFRISWRE